MIGLARYAEANTVMRAMLSEALSKSDYDTLVRAPSIAEAWALLRKTAYRGGLPESAPENALKLEQDLRTACALRFKHSIRRLHGRAAEVARLLLSRWDLDNLEFTLRHWHGHDHNADAVRALPSIVDRISYEALIDANTIGEVIAAVQDTPYADPIALSSAVYREKQSIFFVEIALEKDYYRRLMNATVALGGPDARDGLAALGAEIDAVNLAWLARLMHSGQIESGELPTVLIPGPSTLSQRLTDATASPTDRAQAHTDYVGKLMPNQRDGTEIQQVAMLERLVAEMAVARAQRTFGMYPFRIGSVFAHYVLIRAEMKNLCIVFACKRSGFSEREIESRLLSTR